MAENEHNTPELDEDVLEQRRMPISVILAEMTGRPREEFKYDADKVEFSHPDNLGSVPENEW
jgi:hypothetical protein